MLVKELQVLYKFFKKNLDKGFICASIFFVAYPVLFVKKPGNKL
jgi:hypothetical protein